MTVVMKIDLAGPAPPRPRARPQRSRRLPRRRGDRLRHRRARRHLRAANGRLGRRGADRRRRVFWSACSPCATPPRTSPSSSGRTADRVPAHAALRSAFLHATLRDPVLRACSQAGLVNNLNDALAWGLAPLYLAAHGASVREIAIVAAAYPVVWGVGQLADRLALRSRGPQAADHRRHARPGGRARPARRRRRRLRARARRRGPARRRHGDGLPDADRRRLGRQPAARPRPRRRRLPLLARLRLRRSAP